MIIIVEGPNNVGKTSFINKLLNDPNFKHYQVEHVGSKCPNDLAFHRNFLEYYDNLILDRFYVGETIYPQLYGREAKLTIDDLSDLVKEFENNVVHVFVDADIEFIAKAYKNKDEEPDWEFIYKERNMFNNRFKLLRSLGVRCEKLTHRLVELYSNDVSDESMIEWLTLQAQGVN